MRVLWTDGSASPNPGPGGYAVIEDEKPVALGREDETTNIKMEGMALLNALARLNGEEGEVHTDSEFWINVLTKWSEEWEKQEWTKKKGKIKNLELVKALWALYSNGKAKLVWEKAHVGTEMNELADDWANKARKGEIA